MKIFLKIKESIQKKKNYKGEKKEKKKLLSIARRNPR